ncbi:MAG: copper chaperone PCu(A)C [Sphingomonadaceae bacterium]
MQQPGPTAPPVSVEVRNARLLLPAEAGRPATIYLDLTNTTNADIYLTKAALEDSQATMLASIRTPASERVASLAIPHGQTLRLSPDSGYAILSGYDQDVVPGAETTLQLTFGNASVIRVPLQVQSMVGRSGIVRTPPLPSSSVGRERRTAVNEDR